MKAALAWLARTGFVYLLLFAAIAFFVFAWPAVKEGFSFDRLRQDTMSLEQLDTEIARATAAQQDTWDDNFEQLKRSTTDELQARLDSAKGKKARREREASELGWLARIRPSQMLESARNNLRIQALDLEIAAIEKLLSARRGEQTALDGLRAAPERAVAGLMRECRIARRTVEIFNQRSTVERTLRNITEQGAQYVRERDSKCRDARELARQRSGALQALDDARDELDSLTAGKLTEPSSGVAKNTLRDIAIKAALALLAVLLVPFAIRVLFYYVLAPLVERGPPIRLARLNGMGAVPRASGESRPTLSLTLGEGQELLVRQSYLQSYPDNAQTGHKWLLSWRNILTSLASGMAFLTRARGAQKTFGISARDDPFAEIARIDLPATTSLVMQPRALAAVVQPVGRPMQIRSKWRLFSLHAWLTFQFRYLVFHGPGTLIVKGGRGVRVEQAEDGRRFGQDQLIGFSSDTAYTVARSETFPSYLFGREPLFRDRVKDVDGKTGGILVIEEAPMAGRRTGVRSGLEGAFDAMLKAFGI